MTDSGGLNETEFLKAHRDIALMTSDAKDAAREVGAAKKRAWDIGVDKQAYAFAARLARLDKLSAVSLLNNVFVYAGFLRVAGSEQLSLLDEFDAAAPTSDPEYFRQGYQAYVNGLERDACQHDANSAGGRHWNEGFDAAIADLNEKRLRDGITVAAPAEPVRSLAAAVEAGNDEAEADQKSILAEARRRKREEAAAKAQAEQPVAEETAVAKPDDGPILASLVKPRKRTAR
jgi:ribosome modulation factor